LKCNEKEIENYVEKITSESEENMELEDCEESFTFFLEIKESIISGIWFEDVFIYLNNKNKLNYTIEDKTFSITTLNGNYFLLGFYQLSNKLFFMSKNFQLITIYFPISFIYYQSYILKKEYETAEKVSFKKNSIFYLIFFI